MNFDFIELFFKQDSFTQEALTELKQLVKQHLKSEEERKAALSKINLQLAYFNISNTEDFNSEGELKNKSKQLHPRRGKPPRPRKTKKSSKHKKGKLIVSIDNTEEHENNIAFSFFSEIKSLLPLSKIDLLAHLEVKEKRMDMILQKHNISIEKDIYNLDDIQKLSEFIKERSIFFSRREQRKRIKDNPLIGKTKKNRGGSSKKTSVYEKIALNGGVGKIIYTRAKY